MKLQPDCPVDFIAIDENKVRLIALQVFVLSALMLSIGGLVPGSVLVIDFFLRSFHLQKWSPLGLVAGGVIRALHIKAKPADQAPKRFAARIGFGFSLAVVLAVALEATTVANATALVLLAFSFFESAFGLCAGCYVYMIGKTLTSS